MNAKFKFVEACVKKGILPPLENNEYYIKDVGVLSADSYSRNAVDSNVNENYRYLILYNDTYEIFENENIGSLMRSFAKYTGDYYGLLEKAFNGCVTAEDYVDMYNHFSNNHIDKICMISSILYSTD